MLARRKDVSAVRGSTAGQIAGSGAATDTTVGNGGTQCIGFGERYLPSATGGFEAVVDHDRRLQGIVLDAVHRRGGVPARILGRENA
jgi:hypothetical protein